MLSGKLFLSRNQYIENYEKGLHDHISRELQRKQEISTFDIREGGVLAPDTRDNERFGNWLVIYSSQYLILVTNF